MNWDEIKKLDYREIRKTYLIVQKARAELMYEAFCKSRDLSEWAQYLKDHPPSPETLAVLVVLGLDKHKERLRLKGGKGKAKKYDLIFEKVLAEKGGKPRNVVELELLNAGASQSTITRRLKGVTFPKRKKLDFL
jgi:hypothetical protein